MYGKCSLQGKRPPTNFNLDFLSDDSTIFIFEFKLMENNHVSENGEQVCRAYGSNSGVRSGSKVGGDYRKSDGAVRAYWLLRLRCRCSAKKETTYTMLDSLNRHITIVFDV